MSDGSTIEWLHHHEGFKPATWNPTRGCTRVSEGCRNCYAERMAARFNKPGMWGHGFAEMQDGKPRWTNKVELIEERLQEPLRAKKRCVYFVNSTSDLFHRKLNLGDIDRVFAVMAMSPQHRFLVLTKWAWRAKTYIGSACEPNWPLPNVWLGVSAEDQATADDRIPDLLATPAARRFVSLEPLQGPLNIRPYLSQCPCPDPATGRLDDYGHAGPYLDWVIVGGESGPGARPMHLDWPEAIQEQCAASKVPFFFKQWGGRADHRRLCGREWNEVPA